MAAGLIRTLPRAEGTTSGRSFPGGFRVAFFAVLDAYDSVVRSARSSTVAGPAIVLLISGHLSP